MWQSRKSCEISESCRPRNRAVPWNIGCFSTERRRFAQGRLKLKPCGSDPSQEWSIVGHWGSASFSCWRWAPASASPGGWHLIRIYSFSARLERQVIVIEHQVPEGCFDDPTVNASELAGKITDTLRPSLLLARLSSFLHGIACFYLVKGMGLIIGRLGVTP